MSEGNGRFSGDYLNAIPRRQVPIFIDYGSWSWRAETRITPVERQLFEMVKECPRGESLSRKMSRRCYERVKGTAAWSPYRKTLE